MGRFSQQLEQAAKHAESLARSMEKASETAAPGGGGGGGGTAPSTPIVFNTTLQLPAQGRTVRTGEGSGMGGKDIQSRAFAYFGMSSAGKSSEFIRQIIKAFEELMASGGIQYRTGGRG